MARWRSPNVSSWRSHWRESSRPACRNTTASPEPFSSYQSLVLFTSAYGTGATIASAAVAFEHVLVVGAGQMGGGIAQVAAASGRRVSLHDPYPGAVDRGLAAIEKSLMRLKADVADVTARIAPVDDLVAADLMIEAITEDATAKEELFRRADETLPDHAILASNTSSIPITSLAAATGRPERVI